jgi:hypothetical protein
MTFFFITDEYEKQLIEVPNVGKFIISASKDKIWIPATKSNPFQFTVFCEEGHVALKLGSAICSNANLTIITPPQCGK